jgi:hypothetical protein
MTDYEKFKQTSLRNRLLLKFEEIKLGCSEFWYCLFHPYKSKEHRAEIERYVENIGKEEEN